ncbi:ATP-binding protein [Oceanospirillum sediminis]|uniref:histidine kinase n=1 Tax=Oceanospirillum sediminis TaxID=2760088 RepID=A0A839IWB6_9GAMM|nr:ATP-binding protein [Oceanospirillum sediminis]MBB1488980.1 response regulator [Oceanospirillum sediminis]
MPASQRIFRVRRYYNKWVADQTLEDFALRFTAHSARHMSIERVAKTALGATAFLALEGIAATVTLNYGFTNTVWAMLTVCLLFFITGLPISYYSARHGLDIDLLTRGAGFGYLGSTITSLIYASFTFIFFAIEAVILASALNALLGIPLALGYFLCAVAVIPIVTHGIATISRFQVGTQNIWLVLQLAALFVVIVYESDKLGDWTQFTPQHLPDSGEFNILLFGAAASVFFALVAQIGEQVDYLRFMPEKTEQNKKRWWFWLILAGPGWVLPGVIKMLLGSFLAYLAISQGMSFELATDPTQMYQRVFYYLTQSPGIALLLAALMVILSQMKINVTNAYAGSIAWSNFFSRLTHSHPGRVVWLVFNVTIALLLMELGIYQALEAILGIFAIVAVSWLGSLAADLMINKPLGLSPDYVEFKRAHLYDINPVGTGSMLLATGLGVLSYLGVFGEVSKNLSHFLSLAVCFICVPLIAWLTQGRFYIARQSPELLPLIEAEREKTFSTFKPAPPPHAVGAHTVLKCGICENAFEAEDMSFCPAYDLPICSLCCSLDVRCMDSCKPEGRVSRQAIQFFSLFLPQRWSHRMNSRLARFGGLLLLVNLLNAALLAVVYRQMQPETAAETLLLEQVIWSLFFTLLIASGVVSWLFLLAHESRVVAQKESNRQTRKLINEIEAHKETDLALQQAKELAERANAAKSRYLTGISHELRTPLQSILGYAQLLNDKPDTPQGHKNGLDIIQRSGQYLTDLIEGLLDISRIEAGRLDLYRTQVDLPQLLDQLSSMFAMQAGQKGIQFNCQIHSPLPQFVMTDEKRLRQILINLLSNAVKYTIQGEVEFSVRYRNQVAEFTIKDTGPGIDDDYLQRIFDPFERVRNRDTASQSGTGLGLTIVRLLTEIMGGDLQVNSQVNQGSEFTVVLMLPWVSQGDQDSTEVTEQKTLVGYEGYQRTLCLVDDDPVLRGLLSDLLTPLGFITLEAHDGDSCLKLLDQLDSQRSPDLFLLDVSMPGMNGLELARRLRERQIREPVLMLSADAQEHYRAAEDQEAYNDYLVKPIANHKLLDKLAEQLNLQWSWRETDEQSITTPEAVSESALEPVSERPLKSASESPLESSGQSVPELIPDNPLIAELIAYADTGFAKGVRQVLDQLWQEYHLCQEQHQQDQSGQKDQDEQQNLPAYPESDHSQATSTVVPAKHLEALQQMASGFQLAAMADYIARHSIKKESSL